MRSERAPLRRADARFLLRAPLRRAAVIGDLPHWLDALASAGVDVSTPADVIVTDAAHLDEALSATPRSLIVEGRIDASRLRDRGYTVRRYLAVPSTAEPDVIVPLDAPDLVRYALLTHLEPPTRRTRLRNRAFARALRMGLATSVAGHITIAEHDEPVPFVLRAAAEVLPAGSCWFLSPGGSDTLSRCVFHVVAPGGTSPSHVVKFARVPGYDEPFVRDERGLGLASSAGGAAAAHAPRFVARICVDGFHGSVETSAPGQRLLGYLASSRPRRARLAALERVAAGLLAIGRDTRQPPAALDEERHRLRSAVIPAWGDRATASLVDDIPPVSGVLAHNDPGSWNIKVHGRGFTLLDWESAAPTGLPLWDLVYLLAGSLPVLDRVPAEQLDDYQRDLFTGGARSSSTLFTWVRRGVDELAVPPGAVGAIVTLCWLHHGLSAARRSDAMTAAGIAQDDTRSHIEGRLAARWLADPALGPGWDRWRG